MHFCINNIEANLVGTLLNYSLGCEYELWPNSQPSSHRPGDGGVARDDQDTRGQVHRNTEILWGSVRESVLRLTDSLTSWCDAQNPILIFFGSNQLHLGDGSSGTKCVARCRLPTCPTERGPSAVGLNSKGSICGHVMLWIGLSRLWFLGINNRLLLAIFGHGIVREKEWILYSLPNPTFSGIDLALVVNTHNVTRRRPGRVSPSLYSKSWPPLTCQTQTFWPEASCARASSPSVMQFTRGWFMHALPHPQEARASYTESITVTSCLYETQPINPTPNCRGFRI